MLMNEVNAAVSRLFCKLIISCFTRSKKGISMETAFMTCSFKMFFRMQTSWLNSLGIFSIVFL